MSLAGIETFHHSQVLRLREPAEVVSASTEFILAKATPVAERELVEFLYPSLRLANYVIYEQAFNYKIGDLVYWPARGWHGEVIGTRDGVTGRRIQIAWDERLSKGLRTFTKKLRGVSLSYICDPAGSSGPPLVDSYELDQERVATEDLLEICREQTCSVLNSDSEFVNIGSEWFLRSLLTVPSEDELAKFQERIQSTGGFVTSAELLENPASPEAARLFSLTAALMHLPGVQLISRFGGGEWSSDAYLRELEASNRIWAATRIQSTKLVPSPDQVWSKEMLNELVMAEDNDAVLAIGQKAEFSRAVGLWEAVGKVLILSPAEQVVLNGSRRPVFHTSDSEQGCRCLFLESAGCLLGLEDWLAAIAPGVVFTIRRVADGQFEVTLQDGLCELPRFSRTADTDSLQITGTVRLRAAVDPWCRLVLQNPEALLKIAGRASEADISLDELAAPLFGDGTPIDFRMVVAALRLVERPGRRSVEKAAVALMSVSPRFCAEDGLVSYRPEKPYLSTVSDLPTVTLGQLDASYAETIEFYKEQGELGRQWRLGELARLRIRGLRRTHSVRPHLRKALHPSDRQLSLGRLTGLRIPAGFTFVRGHTRGS